MIGAYSKPAPAKGRETLVRGPVMVPKGRPDGEGSAGPGLCRASASLRPSGEK